jgi:hypothetical protein
MRFPTVSFYPKVLGCAKIVAIGILPCLAMAAAADAAPLTGSMGVVESPFEVPTSSYTSSSVTLNADNLITTALTGDLATQVPAHSDLTAYSSTISGLSTSPLTDSIANFFVFSSPDSTLATSGTTPTNRFDFNLATISEPVLGTITGTGTLVDTTGAFGSAPASFSVGFSGPNNYSFTLSTTPEPASLSVLAFAGISLIRRRRC